MRLNSEQLRLIQVLDLMSHRHLLPKEAWGLCTAMRDIRPFATVTLVPSTERKVFSSIAEHARVVHVQFSGAGDWLHFQLPESVTWMTVKSAFVRARLPAFPARLQGMIIDRQWAPTLCIANMLQSVPPSMTYLSLQGQLCWDDQHTAHYLPDTIRFMTVTGFQRLQYPKLLQTLNVNLYFGDALHGLPDSLEVLNLVGHNDFLQFDETILSSDDEGEEETDDDYFDETTDDTDTDDNEDDDIINEFQGENVEQQENEQVDVIPAPPTNLKILTLKRCYLYTPLFTHLPSSLLKLDLMYASYNHPFNLPELLQVLKLPFTYSHAFVSLPRGLHTLEFWLQTSYGHSLPQLPASLVHLRLPRTYNHPLNLSEGLRTLNMAFNMAFNIPLELPSTLRTLCLPDTYTHQLPAVLPLNLEFLHIGKDYQHNLPLLPLSLRRLSIFEPYMGKVDNKKYKVFVVSDSCCQEYNEV